MIEFSINMKITRANSTDADVRADMKLLEERFAGKEHRFARQQIRMEALEYTMHNTEEDIRFLNMAMHYVKSSTDRIHVAHKDIPRFFERASRMYDLLCHRMHCHINYTCFCIAIHARYDIESCSNHVGSHSLSLTTVTGYFKRERE
jgi:hypothetical protein